VKEQEKKMKKKIVTILGFVFTMSIATHLFAGDGRLLPYQYGVLVHNLSGAHTWYSTTFFEDLGECGTNCLISTAYFSVSKAPAHNNWHKWRQVIADAPNPLTSFDGYWWEDGDTWNTYCDYEQQQAGSSTYRYYRVDALFDSSMFPGEESTGVKAVYKKSGSSTYYTSIVAQEFN
jgi:hypothetical protein